MNMSEKNKPLPHDLVALEQESSLIFERNSTLKARNAYSLKLHAATKKYANSHNQEQSKCLVRCHAQYMDKLVNQYELESRYIDDINVFIKLLVSKKLVKYMTEDLDSSHTLAGVCMIRAMLAKEDKWRHPRMFNVNDVLNQWLGDAPPTEKLIGPHAVSDFLYGNATWLLLQDESNTDIGKIRYIVKQEITIRQNATECIQDVSKDLPVDFS